MENDNLSKVSFDDIERCCYPILLTSEILVGTKLEQIDPAMHSLTRNEEERCGWSAGSVEGVERPPRRFWATENVQMNVQWLLLLHKHPCCPVRWVLVCFLQPSSHSGECAHLADTRGRTGRGRLSHTHVLPVTQESR